MWAECLGGSTQVFGAGFWVARHEFVERLYLFVKELRLDAAGSGAEVRSLRSGSGVLAEVHNLWSLKVHHDSHFTFGVPVVSSIHP